MSTSEGKCVLVEVGALISWCIYSYRIVMLLVPYMWASMTFLLYIRATMTFWPQNQNQFFKQQRKWKIDFNFDAAEKVIDV